MTDRAGPGLLFAYGTLRDPQVQTEVFGRTPAGTPDALDGFEARTIRLADPAAGGWAAYPALRPARQAGPDIAGVALAVSDADLAAADAYEGGAYRRVLVTLRSGRPAFVYVDASA